MIYIFTSVKTWSSEYCQYFIAIFWQPKNLNQTKNDKITRMKSIGVVLLGWNVTWSMVRKPVTSKSPPDRSIAMSALVSVKIRKFLSGHGMAANGGLGLHTSINRRHPPSLPICKRNTPKESQKYGLSIQVDTPKMRQHPKWDTNKSLLISIFWRREGLLQRYATPRHLHEFQKIRMIWKAKETTFRSH